MRRPHLCQKQGRRIPRTIPVGLAAVILFVSQVNPAHATDSNVTKAGDILQLVLPGVAIGSTFIAGNPDGGWWDREGSMEAVLSIGTTAGIVAVGKVAARKLRPDASDRNSFPSGHTAAAFSGASFISTRYGWEWGAAAYAAAAFVGYSRFQADQHYADDILAGASIALLTNWAWVKAKNGERISLLPMPLEGGMGIQLALLEDDPAGKSILPPPVIEESYPRYRFNFNFGPSFVSENKVSGSGGTTFDLRNLQDNDNPLTTAVVQFDVAFNDRHEVGISIWPMEAKDSGVFATPVTFLGVTFPGGTRIHSAWRLFDFRARYRYEFFPKSPFIFAAGGGAMLQYHIVKLDAAQYSLKAEEDDTNLVPFLHFKTGWRVTDRITFYINGDGGWIPGSWLLDGGAYLSYRFRRHWDFTVGYQYFARDIDGDVRNQVLQQLPYLAVAYNW